LHAPVLLQPAADNFGKCVDVATHAEQPPPHVLAAGARGCANAAQVRANTARPINRLRMAGFSRSEAPHMVSCTRFKYGEPRMRLPFLLALLAAAPPQ
jgi:hypothetical protein